MSIIVRRATFQDIDAVERLYDDLNDYLARHINYPRWRKGIYPLREHAEEALEKGELYVASLDGVIVGTAVYSTEQDESYRTIRWQTDFDAPVFIICKLAVHPSAFGRRIGKALLDYAAALGKQLGKKAIRLDTYEENWPAVRLYEKCDFQYMGLVDLGLEKVYGLKWYKVFEKLL